MVSSSLARAALHPFHHLSRLLQRVSFPWTPISAVFSPWRMVSSSLVQPALHQFHHLTRLLHRVSFRWSRTSSSAFAALRHSHHLWLFLRLRSSWALNFRYLSNKVPVRLLSVCRYVFYECPAAGKYCVWLSGGSSIAKSGRQLVLLSHCS